MNTTYPIDLGLHSQTDIVAAVNDLHAHRIAANIHPDFSLTMILKD